MKRWKKGAWGLIRGILLISALLIGAIFLPFPSISGNWLLPWSTSCMCDNESGCHLFLRFEKGKIVWMSNTHFPPNWIGTYKRTGWGKYEIKEFGSRNPPVIVHTTFFYMKSPDVLSPWRTIRDPFILTCRRAAKHPSNVVDWKETKGGTP